MCAYIHTHYMSSGVAWGPLMVDGPPAQSMDRRGSPTNLGRKLASHDQGNRPSRPRHPRPNRHRPDSEMKEAEKGIRQRSSACIDTRARARAEMPALQGYHPSANYS